ncbi:MAG: prepilin-type N-terminal cleavage/methylation domain-containing protein [Lentisphaeria bacterium]|nr:prepilin-type N-terminal cleavage/methylation domain-containing protein [Lentisphaeria bacterium]MBR3687466.1 prepilin-type N-terminal cleavage/methylation domain-containing protein [Lentisphaeria bacterium]
MRKPFTLVEVLIAMSVLSVFLLGLMQFYSSTETVLSSGVERTEMFERARIAMDMMANDLTCIYYSQTDDDLTPFEYSENSYFQVSTIRPEKLNTEAKTNIVGAKYSWNTSKQTLVYSYSDKDTFDVKSATFGNDTELVEGVTDFSVKPYYGNGKKILPSLVVIRMELVDSKTLRRIQANASAKEAILKNANKREFRRMVVIDRGQPKPKL